VANFFTGGPRSKLEMAIGRGTFASMTRVERIDPFVTEVYTRNEATKKPWLKLALSTHVWQAALPTDLSRGSHRVRIRAMDEYGRAHIAEWCSRSFDLDDDLWIRTRHHAAKVSQGRLKAANNSSPCRGMIFLRLGCCFVHLGRRYPARQNRILVGGR
jgi:hypothetical protein